MNGLSNYVRKGRGTLLIESGDTKAQATFLNFLETVDLDVESIPSDHRLLTEPFLFSAPPPGFATKGKSDILVGDGVIVSTREYGRLWQGERHDGLASREEIRSPGLCQRAPPLMKKCHEFNNSNDLRSNPIP
jgi:hypothetical protein